MARIRTIKPEFPHSESMGAVSRDARLLFILLWTIADDSGRLRGNSRLLASLLFPYDSDARDLLPGWMAELEAQDCLVSYEVDGHAYVQVKNWSNHQKIDKPSGSKFPPFVDSSRGFENVRECSSEDQRIKDQGKDQGKDQDQAPIVREDDDDTVVFVKPTLDEVREYMMGKDSSMAHSESQKFFDFYESKGWKVGDHKMQKWRSAASGWLNRAKEKSSSRPAKASSPIAQAQRIIDQMEGGR